MDETQGNSNYALEKLRTLLQSDSLDADGKLPTERTLSEILGVSRRSIRRALEVLEAEGRIWRRQGSGTFAGKRPDGWSNHVDSIVADTDLMEIMEVRLRVEPQLAQLAAMRAKAADVERMYDLVKKIYESTDADGRELWDGALHRQIAQCAGNSFFLTIFDVINRVRQDEAWQTIRERARSVSRTREVTHGQHTAIVDAIAARDPGKAGEAMRQHLLTLQESLIRITSFDHSETQAEKEPT
ncbi:FadR/GntR family transcriptional regulator [Rhizobium sp. BK377]|jgi:GntR family transcriptional regulator, transcriptional repressor for pyruvate dehydrogenase complex|uniref:FadR/GntR family transcriptional regulator n=1 Tax=Rhizobium sp. BK377 TaxID=2587058 RepID=UPI001616EF5A|nr:FadR/GntR family transcriptional regulator [Rhizobium sp. BK377]MBB3463625.1 DNA-binding FadR family transcriptional regulator [Rhizobium sp. BK377]